MISNPQIAKHLVLTRRQTEQPGPDSTANRSYVRETLECWRDPSVSDVILCWGSQTSKTTTLMAGLGWLIDTEPSPIPHGCRPWARIPEPPREESE